MAGVDLPVVEELPGHKSLETALRSRLQTQDLGEIASHRLVFGETGTEDERQPAQTWLRPISRQTFTSGEVAESG